MGNHRAPRTRTAPPRWLTAMIVLTAVFMVVVLAIKLGAGPDADSTAGSRTPSPGANGTTGAPSSPGSGSGTPSVSASPTPTGSSSPSAAPSRTAREPEDAGRLVPSPARRLLVEDLIDAGFDFAVAPIGGRLTSNSADELSRWGARGLPGNPAEDTVVIVGSTAPAGALARLDQVRRGDRISLRTDRGLVTYTVDTIGSVASSSAASTPVVRARVPGRLVLLGARFDGGARTARDLLVVASLTTVSRG